MKNPTPKQIEALKALKGQYTTTRMHGNCKTFNGLPVNVYLEIALKRRERAESRAHIGHETDGQTFRRLLRWSLECIGTNYYKVMIKGNRNIYYASPDYGHADYNKSRIWPNNEKGRKLMKLFNSILTKRANQ
jgi:hypothetical protein